MSTELEFNKKVDDKILQNRVNDYVEDLENPPIKKLAIDIPPNPFDEVDDGDDEFENSELTLKQNDKFRRFLDAKGYDDFNQWWHEEGKERTNDLYTEAMIHNEPNGDVLKWWDKWIKDNLDAIIFAINFNLAWGDTIFKK